MGLDHERVSFSVRIVSVKFRAIPSSFDLTRGVVCNLGKIEYFSGKFQSSWFLGSLERSRRADRFCLLVCHDPSITNPSSGPFLHRTHLRANQSFSLPSLLKQGLTLIVSFPISAMKATTAPCFSSFSQDPELYLGEITSMIQTAHCLPRNLLFLLILVW